MKITLEDRNDWSYDYPEMRMFVLDSRELNAYVDNMRAESGFRTFFDEDDPNMWDQGWYDFYIDINLEEEKIKEFYVEVVANNKEIEDDGSYYILPFDEDDFMRQIKEQIDLEGVKMIALEEVG